MLLKIFLIVYIFAPWKSVQSVTSACRNPDRQLGKCISLYECASLQRRLFELNERNYQFVQLSRCNAVNDRRGETVGKPPYVCCVDDTITDPMVHLRHSDKIIFPDDERLKRTAPTTTTAATTTTTTEQTDKKVSALPRPPNCGALTISNKIYGGIETEPHEFPWMVSLQYRKSNGALDSVCAGSLITERFVLTAAHCVKGVIEQKVGQVVSVRVGEHNTAEEVECDGDDCVATAYTVGLESIIVHKDYDTSNHRRIFQHHDIALLRLDRDVIFSEVIQPVCLPLADEKPLPDGLKLIVAGWGHNGTVSRTDAKQKVHVPYVGLENCREIFAKKFHIADEQLCAGGVYREDSCSGDSGGPLMRLDSNAWTLEGIVSFGRGRGCGLEVPAIYTRVRNYIDWIRGHVLVE